MSHNVPALQGKQSSASFSVHLVQMSSIRFVIYLELDNATTYLGVQKVHVLI